MPICWEEIYNEWESPGNARTFRAEVPGGWIVKDWAYDFDTLPPKHEEPDSLPYISSSMVFVPDPKHEWKIETYEELIAKDDALQMAIAITSEFQRRLMANGMNIVLSTPMSL